jgi:hypothetical protein
MLILNGTPNAVSNGSVNLESVDDALQGMLSDTGHVDYTGTTLAFSDESREFTISPSDTEYSFYTVGVKYTKTEAETVILPDVTALYFIYFDENGDLQYSETSFFADERYVFVAVIYYNADTSKAEFFARETHTRQITKKVHRRLHAQGAAYASGLIAGNYTLIGDGSNNADATLSISNGTIYDEDIKIDINHAASPSAEWQQVLSTIAKLPVGYKLTDGVWQFDTATNYPLKTSTRGTYNLDTDGTWTVEDATANGYHIAMFIMATNASTNPVRAIMGQRCDELLADAKTNNTYGSLDLTGMPFLEFKPLYRLIFQTSSEYTNTPKAKLVDIEDLRGIQSLTVSAIQTTDHNTLSNRTDANSHPASAVSYDNSVSGLSATNTKTAIDELASEKANIAADPTEGNLAELDASGNVVDSGVAVSDLAGVIHYGHLYQDDASGATLALTTSGTAYKWTGTASGLVSGVTYNSTNKQLVVSVGSAGVYELSANVTCAYDATNSTLTAEIYKNNVATGVKAYFKPANSGQIGSIRLHSLLSLAEADTIDLRFTPAANSRTVTLHRVDLVIKRIG